MHGDCSSLRSSPAFCESVAARRHRLTESWRSQERRAPGGFSGAWRCDKTLRSTHKQGNLVWGRGTRGTTGIRGQSSLLEREGPSLGLLSGGEGQLVILAFPFPSLRAEARQKNYE